MVVVSARAASSQLRSHGARRGLSSSPTALAAHNFTMPALSPTMTEGNIATWKIKEGDSFSAGDVLLEIETDKAQMDVEAQDDGVLAKITVGDGSKAVQVGTRIGVTADPGDDLSTLSIPAEETTTTPKKEAEAPKQSADSSVPKSERTTAAAAPPAPKSSSSSNNAKPTKQTYPLYPSVQHLLTLHNLPPSTADQIPSTGPNGRLLKGDVLAYIGKISSAYPSELAARFTKLSHLDLSNIKPMAKKAGAAAVPAGKSAPEAVKEAEKPVEIQVPISLAAVMECQRRVKDSIGVFLPLSTFVARATELANERLPRSRVAKPSADDLFDAVLGLDKVRGAAKNKYQHGSFSPKMQSVMPSRGVNAAKGGKGKSDILDLLAGKKVVKGKAQAQAQGMQKVGLGSKEGAGPHNVFSVSVPRGDEGRGRVFLERVKSVLEGEPGRLVV
ncbi:pyruvate dehydrogenase x component [Pyrenophora seminiperda CCB06]|uniref:Pyruvate dehydrogenase x component n=1 Tax=Pyrenophora seminiperda CCB06 TaxID=1302712 RepID=A0A3M7M5S2_9PLEO|nr:pyruvate dehydrogenase x component [Pyrenophora seminiperda CCB06]